MLLKNKKILLGVTGSIALYKSLELIRLYIKEGAEVRVIMSNGAKKFINPISFEAISQQKILDDLSESWDKNQSYNHIDIGKWADIFVIAPISANSVNKLSSGIADNILLQTALAYNKTILLAPAANTNMLKNPITQKNLDLLKEYNYKIVSSQVKQLVCKDVGDGAMAEPQEIFFQTARELLEDNYWKDRKVIISGGGTIEKIDDIRYISNFSSGKMASSMAKALYYLGANVHLITTRGYDNLPKHLNLTVVKSSQEMYAKLSFCIEKNPNEKKKPFLFMIAAVSDFVPSITKKGKIKKDTIGEHWDLQLKKNIDILQSLHKNSIISIAFKAEMDKHSALENAKNMLKNKNLDGVCLNILKDDSSFATEDNEIELLLDNTSYNFKGAKVDISLEIVEQLKREFNDTK